MENLESLKTKLVREINESFDQNLLLKLYDVLQSKNTNSVAEPPSIYETEKPMTDEEVEDYFKEETIVLPQEILDRLKFSEKQIENGESFTNEEVELYFEEWLKD